MEEDDIELTSSLLEDVIVTNPVRNERKKQQCGYLRKSLSPSFVVFIVAVVLFGVTIGANRAILSRRVYKESNTIVKDLDFSTKNDTYTDVAIIPNIAIPIQDENSSTKN